MYTREQRKIDRFMPGLIAADEAIKDSRFVSENESYRLEWWLGLEGGLDTITGIPQF